ncbi:hypothetical protein ACT8ZR_09025 [Neobacillus sp. M.A.Huq-85]
MSINGSRKDKVTYEETTFFGLLKIGGFKEFITWSMLYSILLTAALFLIVHFKGKGTIYDLAKAISPIELGASATIFSIVLAALAVTISLFHPTLLPALLKAKLLHKYLFPFWKVVAMWGLNLTFNLVIIIFTTIDLNLYNFIEYIFILNTFLFIYSTLYTVKLTGLVIQLTLQRAQL